MMDLFQSMNRVPRPLAERMRPALLEDFVGQGHIIGEGSLLWRAVKADKLGSCIFYGPPGTGKTTLAHIIATNTKAEFEKLNAVSSGVSDAKRVIDEAKKRLEMYGKKTYLLLDECHRWSKAQSDCVLAAIEDGSIIFIGSTTENPYVAMTKAIVSRCRIFEFLTLDDSVVIDTLRRAITCDSILKEIPIKLEDDAAKHLAWAASGALRTAYNALELAVETTPFAADGRVHITKEVAEQSIQRKVLSVDTSSYYDMISAFAKSIRGSDANAALYWSTRLLAAGCDPMQIFRRLLAQASEDIGLADSNALVVVTSALVAYQNMGVPEGLLPLSHAIVYFCNAPKSNSVYTAMARARAAVERFKDDNVPHYLRDRSYPHPIDDGSAYQYPHDRGGWVQQQYLPDSVKDIEIYIPGDNPAEMSARDWMKKF